MHGQPHIRRILCFERLNHSASLSCIRNWKSILCDFLRYMIFIWTIGFCCKNNPNEHYAIWIPSWRWNISAFMCIRFNWRRLYVYDVYFLILCKSNFSVISLLAPITRVQFALLISGICHKVVWHAKWKREWLCQWNIKLKPNENSTRKNYTNVVATYGFGCNTVGEWRRNRT